jgi:CBS domain-containing protein
MTNTTASARQPIQRVFHRHGTQTEHALVCAEPSRNLPRVPTIADQVPVTEIMSRDTTCAHRDLEAAALIDLMVRRHVGCIPIVEEPGRPIGMVTKLDLVERLLATESTREPHHATPHAALETAGDLMMPLVFTLAEHATVAHVAALMAMESIHHVPIVDNLGRLIGVVSAMDVVLWLAANDGFRAPRDVPAGP